MGEPQTIWRRIGLTRGKAALIAVLTVMLVGAICIQYASSESDDTASIAADTYQPSRTRDEENPEPAAAAGTNQQLPHGAKPLVATLFDQSRWKSPELTAVVAHDPFALPDAFPALPQGEVDPRLTQNGDLDPSTASLEADQLAGEVERLRMELEALRQRGVHVIVRGRDQYVALIGDRTIQVGDEINGFTVTAIDPDGVRVERKVNQ